MRDCISRAARLVNGGNPLPSVVETYRRLTGQDAIAIGKRNAVGDIIVPCVAKQNHKHGDAKPSLRIKDAEDVWVCDVCKALGIEGGRGLHLVVAAGMASNLSDASRWLAPRSALQPEKEIAPPPPDQQRLVAEYDYRDAEGKVLYQVRRFEFEVDGKKGKTFSQRRALPGGGWEGRLGDVERVPFRYPEIIAAMGEGKTIYVVEGEKDVLTLDRVGLVATTNAGGAGWKWTKGFVEFFRSATNVVVVGDNDEAGRAAARSRAEALSLVCGNVRVVEAIPGCGPKGDATDWFDENPTASSDDFLAAMMPVAKRLDKPAEDAPIASEREINVTGASLDSLSEMAIETLLAKNDPPRLFCRAGMVTRVERDENDIFVCREVTVPILRYEMVQAATWIRTAGSKTVATEPRRSIVENVLATPELPFPPLRGIVAAPYFCSDGSLVTTSGYAPQSRHILALDAALLVPSIERAPTGASLGTAVEVITDLLIDFPFVDPADRANAIALLVLPFVREMIVGPTPLHLADAPTPGSGKTLLLQTLLGVGCGLVPIRTLGRDDEETRKHLTSILVAGSPAVILDNLAGKVESPSLAAILTAPTWSDRRLGSNAIFTIGNSMIWAASTNNATLTTEIARRSVAIRIDAGVERPENRIEFRHRLPQYARENRGKLIAAACTLVTAWIAAGQPDGEATLGSFEAWARVLGGILRHAGIDGFLGNRERLMDSADAEGSEWRALVTAWAERYGTAEVTALQLVPIANDVGITLGTDDVKNAAMRLGRRLAAKRDRIFCDYRIELRQKKATANEWQLREASEGALGALGGTSVGAYVKSPEIAVRVARTDVPQNTPSTPSDALPSGHRISPLTTGERDLLPPKTIGHRYLRS